MAFWFGDGFDCYALPADALLGYWDSGTTGCALTSGRFSGSRGVVHSATGAWLVKSSGSNDAAHHIVCAYQQTAAISGTTLGLYFQLTDGTTNQCCIVFRSDGAILLTSATPGGTVLATYTGAVTVASTWYAFEIEVVINNTTGSFAVRKNGNTSNDFSASSLNTRPGPNAYANKLTVGSNAAVTGATFDDVLWRSDSTAPAWVGDIRCYTRRPASDAAVQWTPSGSSGLSQSIGSNDIFNMGSADMRAAPFTTYAGTIAAAAVGINGSGAGTWKCAIYADNAGAPGAVLATAAPVASPASGAVNFTFTPGLTVASGTRIWLAFQHNAGGVITMNRNTNAPYNTSGVQIPSVYATFPLANPAPVTTGLPCYNCSITYSTLAGNAGCVSEQQQDAAASYVYSSTVGQADLYTLTSIDSTPTIIIGVTTRGLLQKSDAGTRIITADLKSGGTTVHSGSGVLNTTWGWVYRTDLTDPATGSAWTPTGVNNAQIGVTVTA